jgi:hypothetical protein
MNVCIVLCDLQKPGDSGMGMKYLDDYSFLRSKLNRFPKFRGEMNVAFVVEMINVSVLVSVLQLCAP